MHKYYFINNKIKDKELRVITSDGDNLGVITTQEALRIAYEKGLDLVVISPNAVPPVAKILEFNKFLYQERKDKAKSKSRTKKSELKEIRLKPFTGEGDVNWNIDRAREWLSEGNRVKVWIQMRGREGAHPEICFEKLKKFEAELSAVSKAESPAEQKANIVSITFAPK